MTTKLMAAATAIAMLLRALTAPCEPRARALDKSGTTACLPGRREPQVVSGWMVMPSSSFIAERAGFEPAVGFDPHAALAKRCYRPLSHLSELTLNAISQCLMSSG